MKTDPGIEAVRRARQDISRELGNDPVRLVAHYMEMQKDFAERLVHGPEEAAAEPASTPEASSKGASRRPAA